ncbi:MAG: hypothetical protein IRZ18_00245, partial [Clostridia bacterium]|nr:hypothetical protein [Clostridia bacterium]
AGRAGIIADRAPQIWSVDADRHELHPGILPAGWRWAPWIVVVRRDRFIRTVASSARSVWRLPVTVTPPGTPEGDMPAIRLLESRPDGGILVEAEGRRRWLAPGQSWAVAVVEGRPAAWSDAGDAAWREAVEEALAHGRYVAVWRVTHYGTWPRASLAGGAGR